MEGNSSSQSLLERLGEHGKKPQLRRRGMDGPGTGTDTGNCEEGEESSTEVMIIVTRGVISQSCASGLKSEV